MKIRFKKIEWGIYVLLFALPLYTIRPSFGFLHTTILELLFFVVLVWWYVLHKSKMREVAYFCITGVKAHPFLSVGIGLFLLSATIGIFVAPDKLSALGVWRAYYIEPFLFFLICLSVLDTPRKIRGTWWALLLSGLWVALYAIFQKFTGFGIPMPWLEELRVTSLYPYPNAVGLYLAPLVVMALPFARYLFLQNTRKETIKGAGALIIAMLMLVAIVYAQTEAALVALVVVVGGYGLVFAGKRIRYVTILVSMVIGIMIAVSPLLQGSLAEKLFLRDWSGFVRQTIWHESTAMLSDHWMFGAGLSGYQTAMVPYHQATYLEIFMFPHDIVLNVWSELGLLGIVAIGILLAWGIGVVVRVTCCIKKESEHAVWYRTVLLVCSLVALVMLIHGLVDVPYFKNDLAVLTWFFFALFVALRKSVTISPIDRIH